MKRFLAIVLFLCMLCTSFAMAEESADTYTYNQALADFPTNWSPLQEQTNQDSVLMQYLVSYFYDFDYNETMDGYQLIPTAAADYPVDVTADYVGEQWGIAEGDTELAWKITIRDNMMWQDGTPITAKDFETSAQLLLDPIAQNYRADSLYSGNMVIKNAEGYLKQGVAADTTLSALVDIYGVADVNALLEQIGDEPGFINWTFSFGDTYDFDAGTWSGEAEDAIVDSGKTIKELYEFYTTGAGAEYATWAAPEDMLAYAMDELYGKYTAPEMSWDNVGIKALSDTEFVVILDKPISGFYLYYSFDTTWLVNEKLYKACETVTDGVYTNTYGTSVDTTISFGPYMLTAFQSDKEYTLEKNPYWFGYSMDEYAGQYQATKLQYDCVAEPSTRLEMFLNGKLDYYALNKDDMEAYSTSDYTYYEIGDSVFAMVFNPDLTALTANQAAAGENINKTILTLKDFRIAMSLAMDRAKFCLAASPTNGPGLALYSSSIISDPDNGIAYRNTAEAKQVMVDFWGLTDEIGEGKTYATIDDAIDSITGYNLEMARTYFDSAYDEAIAGGLMDDNDVVQIIVGTPNATSVFYNNGYDFIVSNYTEAVKGTKLEGKLTFTRDSTLGNGFADALRANNVDMLFGVGWTGSTFDPYGLMEAYTSSNYQYDPSWDATTATIDITLDDVTYTATALDWTSAISGTEITATKADTSEAVTLAFPYSTDEHEASLRMQVLAALENAVLQNYNFIPLMTDARAALKSMQVEYYTEEEVFPMGYGGVRYLTFNYTDAEWDAYVAEQGGTLNYK